MSSIFPQTKESQQHPAKCKFCELAVQLSNLDVHESHCGSQTEHCPHCNQPITLRVLAQHKDVCQRAKGRPEEGEQQGEVGEGEGSFQGQTVSWAECR